MTSNLKARIERLERERLSREPFELPPAVEVFYVDSDGDGRIDKAMESEPAYVVDPLAPRSRNDPSGWEG